MADVVLYDYWRSSASYRVRIALALAGIDYDKVRIDLLKRDHKNDQHLARNPQGLVPVLEIDGHQFTQSLAILNYLNDTRDMGLLPKDAALRAKVTALAHSLAIDIHPVCNLSVVAHVAALLNGKEGVREDWMRHFIKPGLEAFEVLLENFMPSPFINGDRPGLVEICLMPQLYNADRWGVDYSHLKKTNVLKMQCEKLPAFQIALPTDN